MSKDFLLAIDQGTSNTKAIVIDRLGIRCTLVNRQEKIL